MARIVAAEYLTLDGVAEDPGPTGDFEHRGWTMPYWSDDLGQRQSELLDASDALLLGRVTYEEFAASWPQRSGDPFTDKINSMPKFVASTTLEEPLEWNAALLEDPVVDSVRKLKAKPGGDLLIYGSGRLVDTLLEHGLIDVLRVMLYPVALGTGERLFRERDVKATFSLADMEKTSTGVAVLTYEQSS